MDCFNQKEATEEAGNNAKGKAAESVRDLVGRWGPWGGVKLLEIFTALQLRN